MFMNDCAYKIAVRNYVINYLAELGLPSKKLSRDVENVRTKQKKVFNVPLRKMHKTNVIQSTGQTLPVPTIVHELCEYIKEDIKTEGIFRLAGSRSAQEALKLELEERGYLGEGEWNVIDIAAILKFFLRELPKPLVPYSYHDLFVACGMVDNKEEVLLLATLLLPMENLNLLTYLMIFFEEVSTYSELNKMGPYNIAVCIAPNILPLRKFSDNGLYTTIGITELWIKNATEIGVITDEIQQKLLKETRIGDEKANNAFLQFLSDCRKMLHMICMY